MLSPLCPPPRHSERSSRCSRAKILLFYLLIFLRFRSIPFHVIPLKFPFHSILFYHFFLKKLDHHFCTTAQVKVAQNGWNLNLGLDLLLPRIPLNLMLTIFSSTMWIIIQAAWIKSSVGAWLCLKTNLLQSRLMFGWVSHTPLNHVPSDSRSFDQQLTLNGATSKEREI